MRKVKRWRYDCDYCKKTGGSKWHMENHEKICTANPKRECGFCELMEEEQPDIDGLKKIIRNSVALVLEEFSGEYWNRLKDDKKEATVLEELRKASNGCPVCMLAAIRQTKTSTVFSSFDFKGEKKGIYDDFTQPPETHY